MAGSNKKKAQRKSRGGTKAQLIDKVYRRHGGLTKSEAAEAVEAIFATVKNTLEDGREVKISNFGVFKVVSRRARRGVNPVSGEPITIPPQRGLTFRPSDRLKQKVDGRKSDES